MEQATAIHARLSEVEKMDIRRATPGRIEWLASISYQVDMPLTPFDERVAVMEEVQSICLLEFQVKSAEPGFGGVVIG